MTAESAPSVVLTLREATEVYLDAGMSIIPCDPGGKRPNFELLRTSNDERARWEPYQTRRPTPILVGHWLRADPRTNLAIVCGEISGNLVVLDIDDVALVAWLEASAANILRQAWVVRTGSGKLHIYIRSAAPMPSTVLKSSTGAHLIDVRSDGEYIMAPPSIHPSGAPYVTLFGDPTSVPRISDPLALARQLVARFEASGGTPSTSTAISSSSTASTTSSGYTPTEWDDDGRLEMTRKLRALRVPERVRQALARPFTPGSKPWESCPSESEVHYVVCKELTAAGLSRETIHDCWQSFPIGEEYRTGVPNRSAGYLDRTIDKAIRDLGGMRVAATQAIGENFEISHALRLMGDPPAYELKIKDTSSGETGTAFIRFEELATEHKFVMAVLRQMPRLLPVLKNCHSGKNWYAFIRMLATMAELEAVPDEASAIGHLRATILSILSNYKIESVIPATPGAFVLGWRDNTTGLIYLRGARLLNDLGMLLRQMPAPDKVWEIMRGLGAQQKRIKIGPSSESLWVLPTRSVDRR